MGWITNNPKLARLLRAADLECEQAIARAGLQRSIGAKVAAIREVKARRLAKYDLIRELES